jgi:hypothetical protein
MSQPINSVTPVTPVNNENKLRTFYELKNVRDLNNSLNKSDQVKIFICNHCGHWNRVKESDLITDKDLIEKRKKEKVDLHIRVTPELHESWKKFVANFGTSERTMIIMMDNFFKHNK